MAGAADAMRKVTQAIGTAENAVQKAMGIVESGAQLLANFLLSLPPAKQLEMNLGFQAVQKVATDRYKMPIPMMKVFYLPNLKTKGAGKALDVMADMFLDMMQEWMKPNLGGIVINVTAESQARQNDISENMIIIQTTNGTNKEYNTDNTSPYPRTWRVEGYLSSNSPWADEHFILRPTLVWQQMMLDAYATSRKPVLYKSGLAPFVVPVLIENYEIGRVLEGTNGYSVSISLREFVTYTVPIYNPGSPNTDMLLDPDTGIQTAILTTKNVELGVY